MHLVGLDAARADQVGQLAINAARSAADAASESRAWRARGLAALEAEDMGTAEAHLRRAIEAAGSVHRERAAEARLSLALVLISKGESGAARRQAGLAVRRFEGLPRARALVQYALIQQRCGATARALETYAQAIQTLRQQGDALWEARGLNNRGLLLAYLGQGEQAEQDLQRSVSLLSSCGQHVTAADVRWNLGFVAGLRGDAVQALRRFDEAGAVLEAATVNRGSSFLDRCHVMLTVGLVDEARHAIENGLQQLLDRDVRADVPEARLLLSETLLSLGERGQAELEAQKAEQLFSAQGRGGLAGLARYAQLRAAEADDASAVWMRADRVGRELRVLGWRYQADDIALMQMRRRFRAGSAVTPAQLLTALTASATGPVTQRIDGWYTVALARLSTGNAAAASRALAAALAVHDRHRETFAATELLLHSASRVSEVAELGMRLAVAGRSPRRVLDWAERWRSGSLRIRPVQPPSDARLAELLSAFRSTSAEIEQARSAGEPPAALSRRLRVLENHVRQRARLVEGTVAGTRTARTPELLDALQDRVLIEYISLDGRLGAVVLGDNRCSLHWLADTRQVREELDRLRFCGKVLAGGASPVRTTAAQRSLVAAQERLGTWLLEPLARRVEGRRLVVVPTGDLHALPWALLERVAEHDLVVAPSATVWLSASRVRPASHRSAVVVAGPGLPAADQELAAIASEYAGPIRVLPSDRADVASVLSALDGSSYAHIAAHGALRSDNPLLSSLQMADGPLTVYDLEGLSSAPEVVVLSACESGLSAVRAGDEIMGLAAAFLRLGTRSLVASVVPVADDVARDTMLAFNSARRQGASTSAALVRARQSLAPEQRTAAASFVCFGSG